MLGYELGVAFADEGDGGTRIYEEPNAYVTDFYESLVIIGYTFKVVIYFVVLCTSTTLLM